MAYKIITFDINYFMKVKYQNKNTNEMRIVQEKKISSIKIIVLFPKHIFNK